MKRKYTLITIGLMVMLLVGSTSSLSYSQEKITLRVWDTASPTRLPLQEIVCERFEKKYPGVIVKFEGIPWSGFREKILTGVAGGTAGDVIHFSSAAVYGRMGVVIPLDDYINGPDGIDKSQWIEGAWVGKTWKGKIYGLPFSANISGFSYNLDRLDEVGASIPETWEEFKVLLRKLTEKDSAGKIIHRGLQLNYRDKYLSDFCFNFGGKEVVEISQDVKQYILNSPESVQALTDARELYEEGVARPGRGPEAFITGYVGVWGVESFCNMGNPLQNYPDVRWAFRNMPPPEGREPIVIGSVYDTVFIPISAKDKDWAWKLLKHYTSKESCALIWQGKYGALPLFKDILDKEPAVPAYEFYQEDKALSDALRLLVKGIDRQGLIGWHAACGEGSNIELILDEEFGKALRGTKTPEEALNDMAKKITEILQSF